MTNKLTTYWLVRSAEDGSVPVWEQLDAPPATTEGLHGDLKIENDDQIMMVFFVDATAQERVTRAARDAAALAQEFMIPHRPARPPDGAGPCLHRACPGIAVALSLAQSSNGFRLNGLMGIV